MIGSVKITLLLCLTGITSCILFLSYGEYINRYELITTQNNGIYIFDKKTVTLNKCENGKCEMLQTNFPEDRLLKSPSVQAIQSNATNSIQNVPPNSMPISASSGMPTSETSLSNQSILTGNQAPAQTKAVQQNNVSTTSVQTLKPAVNSFLNTNDQLPTLQQSLRQSTYGRQA